MATATPTATPDATAEASQPADAAPPAMHGTWGEVETPAQRLLIGPLTYRITAPDGHTGSGAISVTGDVIRFQRGNLCDGIGDYRWTLEDGLLTFDPIEPDGCPGRARALDGATYELLFPPS